ncbi:MAG: hypothetical protein HYS27_02685 [Deltaproteobacteria bacterium]|nr:hypothetical protein [Deltaproteobacteria bacterium]
MLTRVRGGNVERLRAAGGFTEHPEVQRALAYLERRAGKGGASSMLFLPARGTAFQAWAFAYDTGLAKEMNITRATGDVLRGTLVINISGHASGGLSERVLGWVERELTRQGVRIGDDAKRFLALRSACDEAVRAHQAQGGHGGALEVRFEGKTIALPRQLVDQMRRASIESGDAALFELAELGNDALRKVYGSENTYHVRVRTPDGKVTDLDEVPRNQPSKVEYATRMPVELPLLPGETVIEAWPTNSAGVAGYVEARRYRIHFGKDLFDANKADAAALGYQAAHTEIRWGTTHEHDDLERNGVNPSPRPYQDF